MYRHRLRPSAKNFEKRIRIESEPSVGQDGDFAISYTLADSAITLPFVAEQAHRLRPRTRGFPRSPERLLWGGDISS